MVTLKDLKKWQEAYEKAKALPASLHATPSEEVPAEAVATLRTNARNRVRGILADLGVGDPHAPLSDETYDETANAYLHTETQKVLRPFRAGYQNLVKQIPSANLDDLALAISPITLDDKVKEAKLHNPATEIHAEWMDIHGVNADFDSGKMKTPAYTSNIVGRVAKHVKGIYKKEDENTQNMWMGIAAKVVKTSENHARYSGQRLENAAVEKFDKYFADLAKDGKKYTKADYARNNLAYRDISDDGAALQTLDEMNKVAAHKPKKKK